MPIQRSHSSEEEESALEALGEWLWETGNEALVRAVGTWMRQVYVHVPGRPEDEALPRLGNSREGGAMLYAERVREWMAEREEKGRTEGRVEMMRRMAARKFGAGTAQRLAERLEGLHDAERMAQIGEWIIEYESGADLLARLDQVNAVSPNRDAPAGTSCSTRIEGT